MAELTFLPYEDIKKAILHPDQEVRKLAVAYFGDSHSRDETIMPMIIQAVEKYGREGSLGLVCHAHRLEQTRETLEWAIRELENGKIGNTGFMGSYNLHLAAILTHAPLEFLTEQRERILRAPLLDLRPRERIQGLLSLSQESFEALWKKLKEFCEKHKNDESLKDSEFIHECILMLLCCFKEQATTKVMEEIIRDPMKMNTDDDPDWWMELFVIRLAGDLRLEAAVEIILDKYHDDYDYRNDSCTQALTAIGTDSAVEAIYTRFPKAPEVFRQYTTEVFESIHSPRSAVACLDLLDRESDLTIRTNLAMALMSHFSYEGMDRVYQLVKSGKWDKEFCDLKEDFAWTCLLMGRKYPESESWEEYARKQFLSREKRLKEMEGLFSSIAERKDSFEPPSKPKLPNDLRSLEKTMFNIHRALRENKVETKEQTEHVLKKMMRKIVPSFAPRDSSEAAQELVYKAFDAEDSAERVRLAREALKLSENCTDAYVILGEESDDLGEAIAYYRKGVEAGERLLGKDFFEENAGHFWGIFETRPYMRARFNLADALWHNNQRKESLDHLRELLRLNPNDNQGVRYTLTSRLLELRHYEELKDLIENKYPESFTADWLYTKALMYFELEGDTARSMASLEEAVESNKHVPEYLIGIKEIPDETTQTIRIGGEDEAVYYCQENADLWWRNDKAMKWLERQVFPREPYRSLEDKTGRNDPCPCGSGKKYKKCCLR